MEALEKKIIPAQTVISIQHTGAYDEIGAVYHKLHQWAAKHAVRAAGSGFTIFLISPNEFDPASALFEVCIPVEGTVQGDAEVKVKKLSAMSVAASQVKGPYNQIPAHYTEMLAWLDAQGWEVVGPPREVYVKRPQADGSGDPSQFVTEIQFPVAD
jgi:effector-binding domain-containing protein